MTANSSLHRRTHAAAVLGASLAGFVAYQGATFWQGSPFAPAAFAIASVMGVAAFGLTRRSLAVQIVSRGAMFVGCAPLLVRLALGAAPRASDVATFLVSAVALWLARPMLEIEEARRAFAPARFRGAFLAGATTMTAAAIVASAYAIAGVAIHSPIQIAFNAGLAVVLLVAVRALMSMRTWGLLLGAFTSLTLLALAPFYGSVNAATLSLAAAPALLLWVVPLLIARKKGSSDVTHYRVVVGDVSAADADSGSEVEGGSDEDDTLPVYVIR